MVDFDQQAEEAIPADVRMISGCQDSQTSADVKNVSQFCLPDPAGKSGGACTSALLKVLYNEKQANNEDLSFVEVLNQMREELSDGQYTQIPQLSASRPIDVDSTFELSGNNSGTKRAVLIGINYVGQKGELSGCHNDVHNIYDYLTEVQGFSDDNMTILMDDGVNHAPTYKNIISALKNLAKLSQPGDAAFVHYSGHGGQVRDTTGDEKDGYDETLIPVDYLDAGQITDDDLFKNLVCAMPSGSTLTCLMDCCHSGTVLDLPYQFIADGEQTQMTQVPDFDFGPIAGIAIAFVSGKVAKAIGEEETSDLFNCASSLYQMIMDFKNSQ